MFQKDLRVEFREFLEGPYPWRLIDLVLLQWLGHFDRCALKARQKVVSNWNFGTNNLTHGTMPSNANSKLVSLDRKGWLQTAPANQYGVVLQ